MLFTNIININHLNALFFPFFMSLLKSKKIEAIRRFGDISTQIGVGYKDPLLHTRIAYYLEQPPSPHFFSSQDSFTNAHFSSIRDFLAHDIALLIHLGIYEQRTEKEEDHPGTVFCNSNEKYRGFISLSHPIGADLFPTINARTNVGDHVARYHSYDLSFPFSKDDYNDPALTIYRSHRMIHNPDLATFAFSTYLWYLYLYEEKQIKYVAANWSNFTSALSLPPCVRIFSAHDSPNITSQIILPEALEYAELSRTGVDARIPLPLHLKGYAAAKTRTDSSLAVPSSLLDLDLHGCCADDSLKLSSSLETFCAPYFFKGTYPFSSSLRRLSIRSCPSFPFSSYNWPPSLEELDLFDYCIDGNHKQLPEELDLLHIDPRLPHRASFLPRKVRADYLIAKETYEDKINRKRVYKKRSLHDELQNNNEFVSDFDQERFFLCSDLYAPPVVVPTLEDFFSSLFPSSDSSVVLTLMNQITSFSRICLRDIYPSTQKVTDESYSGVVFSFVFEGKKIYCKISSDLVAIKREEQYSHDAWVYPLLRPITPFCLGSFSISGAAGLLTYGTENEGIVQEEDFCTYFSLRAKIFEAYGRFQAVSSRFSSSSSPAPFLLSSSLDDPCLVDVFNRALAHTLLSAHKENKIYIESQSPLILPFEMLVDRASSFSSSSSNLLSFSSLRKDLIADLISLEKTYREISARYMDTSSPLAPTLVHFDSRPENIFPSSPSSLSVRALGDAGFARLGFPEYDLARQESRNDAAYVAPYLFFREQIAKEVGMASIDLNPEHILRSSHHILENRVAALSFLFSARTFSSKLSRGVFDQATYYRDLAFFGKRSYLK